MRRPVLLIIALSIGASFAPVSARAAVSPEARFVQLINQERVAAGLSPLRSTSSLGAIAERHSERMRRDADIYHNSNLANEITGRWTGAGENVGVGFDVDGLHAAFMASHDHRVNIMGARFDDIGLGVVIDDSGEVYVTEVFVDRGSVTIRTPKPPRTEPVVRDTPRPAAPPTTNGSTPTVREPEQPAPFKVVSRKRIDRRGVVKLLIRIVSTS